MLKIKHLPLKQTILRLIWGGIFGEEPLKKWDKMNFKK